MKEEKTVRIDLETWRKLNSLRGINDCTTFQDVINFLIKTMEDNNQNCKEEI